VQNSSASSSSSSSHVHVVFKYDANPFLEVYLRYVELPFKVISFFTFALIILRCHNLGIRRSSSSGLPLLTSTRNLVVLMALPVAVSILTMVSLNGLTHLGEGSTLWVTFSAGLMWPCLNVSSSVVVARFWSSRRAHLAANQSGTPGGRFSEDPAKTQPITTLLIVFIGLSADIFLSTLIVFSSESYLINRLVLRTFAGLLAIGGILTTAYFFRSGIQVLRSLSSSNKPLKTMAVYMLMVAGFTLMIIVSFVMVGSGVYLASVEGHFLFLSISFGGNYGTSLCHLFIFTAEKTCEKSGDDGDDDETFLETENRELLMKNHAQYENIARLVKENGLIKEAADLETKLLHTSLQQAETNAKLLKAEKGSLKRNAKATLLSALREIRRPLDGILTGLKHILSCSPESSSLNEELKYIAVCARHVKVLANSAIYLDTFITGNKKFQKSIFNPLKLCRDVVVKQALSAREGVDVVLISNLKDGIFTGTPSQLALVLACLLSSAALSSAAESTRVGKVELRAEVVEDAELYQDIRFAVADTGQVVPEELQSAFFGTRGQLGNESDQIKAFGFGIFAAHEFLKRMRGVLALRSPTFMPGVKGGGETGGGETGGGEAGGGEAGGEEEGGGEH